MSTHARPRPIPIVIVAGFLGSGKTTLMRRLIAQARERGLRLAVIVNEFGEVDVDANILRQSDGETSSQELHGTSSNAVFVDDFIASLAGGCACCSGRAELHETLWELASRPMSSSPLPAEKNYEAANVVDANVIDANVVDASATASEDSGAMQRLLNADAASVDVPALRPDVILMEASGLADPITLLEVVTAPDLLPLVRVALLAGVVDAARYAGLPQALAPLLSRQLQLADFLVLNKADLVEENRLADVETRIRAVNAGARLEKTSQAMVRGDIWQIALREASTRASQRQLQEEASETASDEAHHAQSHTLVCALPHPVERARLEAALKALPDDVWRVKGFVRLRGESGWFLLQYTGGAGGGRSQMAPFFMLAGTDEPSAALVFIGGALDADTLRRDFGSNALGALW